jgi:hypothetical protein
MDLLVWVWWVLSAVLTTVFAVLWFLISGWVSTLLQVALLVMVIYFLKYGWQRAPLEIWRRTRTFGRFFLNWIRAPDASSPEIQAKGDVRVIRIKEFGDVNISTLLSLLLIVGLLAASHI